MGVCSRLNGVADVATRVVSIILEALLAAIDDAIVSVVVVVDDDDDSGGGGGELELEAALSRCCADAV